MLFGARQFSIAVWCVAALALAAGCGDSSSHRTATPTLVPTATATQSHTPSPTATATAAATATSSHSPTPSATFTATPSATPSASPTPPSSPLPVGLAALTDFDALARLRPPGVRVEQISSYDRSGGNGDLGVGPDTVALLRLLGIEPVELDNSYLYREGERYVIFDERGPGVVYRIWMTGLDSLLRGALGGDIEFEFDDEPVARVQLTRTEFFSGEQAPFLSPLVGNSVASAGGFYSVLPMPFAQRLRITTSTVPNWVHISFARLPSDQVITSFDPSGDTSGAAALLAAAGTAPPGTPPTLHAEIDLAVAAHGEAVLWERDGPGTVLRLELLAPAASEIPLGLRLQAYWDGASEPQVDAPLDDLFGAGLGPAARSLAFGRDGDRFYFYFAMPFRAGARLVLRNDGDESFTGWQLRLAATDAPPPSDAALFHARAAAARVEPDERDYVLLDTEGTGHVVAIVMQAACGGVGRCELPPLTGIDGAHLEGDERIAVDGSRYPQIHGTGLEDFFNGGFYFAGGPVVLATHGNPVQAPTSTRRPGLNLRSAYRLLLGDAIPFASRIRLAIEHGPVNDVPAEMSSLVLYYAIDTPTLIETDRIAIGTTESEAAHAFAAQGRTDRVLRSAFRGDDSDVELERAGLDAVRTTFRIAVAATNRGVRLRRLADIGSGAQTAAVLVDGRPAGTWSTADVNPILRWAELDFDIPAALTAGSDTLTITLDATDSPTPWTAFEYTAFSYATAPH